MTIAVKRKVVHREWDELHLSAHEFFAEQHLFIDDDDLGERYPKLLFDGGVVVVDEMWGVRDGRVWTYSLTQGLVKWRDDQYVELFHGHVGPLGQFTGIEIVLTDKLREKLKPLLEDIQ